MAIKTWSSGEVLTASDLNTYAGNPGLVYVTSGPLSGTATNFASCFSATFTNYLITVDQVQASASANIYIRYLSGTTPANTTDYFWATMRLNQSNVGGNTASISQTFAFTGFGMDSANGVPIGSIKMDIYAPQVSVRTFFYAGAVAFGSGETQVATTAVRHNLVASYDGIQFLTNSAATMGGNVTVYGYRKA